MFVAELLREPARPIKYLILPELDHGFVSSDDAETMLQVIESFLSWALGEEKGRAVAVGF